MRLDPTPHDIVAIVEELADFFRFCRELVEARAEKPGDDYASRMIAIRGGDDAVLTMNEIVSLVFGLLLAGHETTTNASSNLILELLSQRRQWDALVAEPSRIPNAVEEGLLEYFNGTFLQPLLPVLQPLRAKLEPYVPFLRRKEAQVAAEPAAAPHE